MASRLVDEVEADRRRNLEDIIRHARWEAERAKRLGRRWCEVRDRWLIQAHETDKEMLRHPKIREALVKSMIAKDKVLRGSKTQQSKLTT